MDIDVSDYVIVERFLEYDKFGTRVKHEGRVVAVGDNVPAEPSLLGVYFDFNDKNAPKHLAKMKFSNSCGQVLCGIRYSDAKEFFQEVAEHAAEHLHQEMWSTLKDHIEVFGEVN